MKITRAGDYALRALSYMAKNDYNKIYMRSELSELCKIPDSFLGKILQSLAKSDIMISERGKKGGFKLNKKPEEISIYDVIKSVEGTIIINECLMNDEFCKNTPGCKIHIVLDDIRNTLINKMKTYSVADIA